MKQSKKPRQYIPAWLQRKGEAKHINTSVTIFARSKVILIPQTVISLLVNSSLTQQYTASISPNSESIPRRIIVEKKTNSIKLGKGSITRALGRTLKLNSKPESLRVGSSILYPDYRQKWDKQINIVRALRRPQRTSPSGTIRTLFKRSSLLALAVAILRIVPFPRDSW